MNNIKQKFGLALIIFSGFAFAKSANASEMQEGFCVRFGDALTIENAIVTVSAKKINHQFLFGGQGTHNFFDFENGTLGLYVSDWNGNMALVKPSGPFIVGKNIALFTDTTHFGMNESAMVECKAIAK